MSRQNPHVRINQSGARIGMGLVENLNANQICGSRGKSQPIPEPQVANPKVAHSKSEQPKNSRNPRRSIAIGVDLSKRHSNNPQYSLLENPKNSNTNSIAEVVGDFVEAVMTSLFGS